MGTTQRRFSLGRVIGLGIRTMGFLVSLALLMVPIALIALYGIYRKEIPPMFHVSDYRPNLKSKVFAQNGELIAEFGVYERVVIEQNAMPPLVQQAFVSSEDKNFYRHHGIDFVGIVNAIFQSLTGQRATLRGASTITQQLAKSLLVKQDGYEQATARTLSRKIKEALLARRLEMNLTKEDILWIYLNEVYLGHGSYGVGAAAKNYFRKELAELSLSEIALIAGLPQAPSRFSPQTNMSAALARQAYVLGRLREDKIITTDRYEQALADNKNLKVYDRENSFRKSAPYFSETVRRAVIAEFGEDRVYEDGLNIYTTLDINHERAMQRVLKHNLAKIDKRQGFSGPIFRPSNDHELTESKKLIHRINKEGLIRLRNGFFLAMVTSIDEENDGVFIKASEYDGVIPLAGMFWARPRDPKANYDWWKLKQVAGVLQIGDVVLVRLRTQTEMEAINAELRYQSQLTKLIAAYRNELNQKQLRLFSLEQEPTVEGAMFSIEVGTGYVTAMNGGYSFDRSEFNRVYQACRQPGSLFKPIVYAAAIAQKNYTPATMITDAPLTFHDAANESTWRPKNFDKAYKGEVTMREALIRSMNIPTLNVMADVGINNVLAYAKTLGIETKLKAELGTAIGSSCVTPWELSRVFSAIANAGVMVEPQLIKEITDRDHKRIRFYAKKDDPWLLHHDRATLVISDFFTDKPRVLDQETAYTMHYLLKEGAQHGTAARTNALQRHIAGKTGTTNDSFDVWFAGYSKRLLSLVWIGNDTMEVPLGVYEQGARTSLPLFNDFMQLALKNLPNEDWEMPATMCNARIDAKTGLRILNERPHSFIAPFRCGFEPPLFEEAPTRSLEQTMELMGGM